MFTYEINFERGLASDVEENQYPYDYTYNFLNKGSGSNGSGYGNGWDIIMEKFTTQELGDSQLTFRDLETIKKSFVQVLAGYYHSRIEYPKVKEAVR